MKGDDKMSKFKCCNKCRHEFDNSYCDKCINEGTKFDYMTLDDYCDKIQDMKEEIEQLKQQNKRLIGAYDNYIKILDDELTELVGIAYEHDWRSSRAEEGEKARKLIKEVKGE